MMKVYISEQDPNKDSAVLSTDKLPNFKHLGKFEVPVEAKIVKSTAQVNNALSIESAAPP